MDSVAYKGYYYKFLCKSVVSFRCTWTSLIPPDPMCNNDGFHGE